MGPKLTQAEGFILGVGAKMFSCCGARHLPCRRSGFVICRPRPLAQVASSATGGAPIAPHRKTCHRLWCFSIGCIRNYLLDNHIILAQKACRGASLLLRRLTFSLLNYIIGDIFCKKEVDYLWKGVLFALV